MAYGIQDFYKTAQKYGLARNNVFRINQISNGVFLPDSDSNLYIYVKEGGIPSRQIQTGKVSWKAFDFNVPLNAIYPENTSWRVSFYSDQSYILRSCLELWSKGTFSEHGHYTKLDTNQKLSFGNCDVEIMLLDLSAKLGTNINEGARNKQVYTLKGCFPTNIGGISYNTTSSGEIISVDATLAFQYVESLNKNINT